MSDHASPEITLDHWTNHAIERFIERYSDFEISPREFLDFVPRIEFRWRHLFKRIPKRGLGGRVVLVTIRTWNHKKGGFVKVRAIYNHRARQVITVLPPKLDDRSRRIVHLSV